jgi:transcriptional regulator with XRE-family HTH domain
MVEVITPEPLPLNERVPLAGFPSLTAWLEALLARNGQKAKCAKALGTSSQRVNKWLKESIPDRDTLKALATWAGVDFFDLQLKTYQIERPENYAPTDNERWTATAKGAMVGRRWEELHRYDPSLAGQFADLLDGQVNTLLKREQPRQVAAPRRRA